MEKACRFASKQLHGKNLWKQCLLTIRQVNVELRRFSLYKMKKPINWLCLATLHLIVVDKSRACQHNRTPPPDTSSNAMDSPPWMLKRRAKNQAHLMQAILLHATYPAPFLSSPLPLPLSAHSQFLSRSLYGYGKSRWGSLSRLERGHALLRNTLSEN